MTFPSNGKNHHSAIKNENKTFKFLEKNAHKIYNVLTKNNYKIIAKGGTANKADNIIEYNNGKKIYISDKEKKKGLGGSYDYTNTSKPINDMIKTNTNCVKEIKSVYNNSKKDKGLSIEKRKKLVEKYRSLVKKASHYFLKNLTSNNIINLIKHYLIEPNIKMQELITDGKENKRYTFPFTKHPVINLINNNYTTSIKFKKDNGQNSSGHIIFSKDDKKIDIGLRMRIHTNNGVTALLDAGGANNNSIFVMKFQQDDIKSLLNKMGVSPIEV